MFIIIIILLQINLPQSVCRRWSHSVSSIRMNTNTQSIIVTGGYGMGISPIIGDDVVMIIEIGMCIIITHDNSYSVVSLLIFINITRYYYQQVIRLIISQV